MFLLLLSLFHLFYIEINQITKEHCVFSIIKAVLYTQYIIIKPKMKKQKHSEEGKILYTLSIHVPIQ